MKRLLLLLLSLVCKVACAETQFGVATLSPDGSCAIFATPLPAGVKRVRVTGLNSSHPNAQQWVALGPRTSQACPAAQAAMIEGTAFYPLQLPQPVSSPSYQTVQSGKLAFHPQIRSCSTGEGLWLSAWSAQGHQRLWHAYVYLGYDVQPNCTAKDDK